MACSICLSRVPKRFPVMLSILPAGSMKLGDRVIRSNEDDEDDVGKGDAAIAARYWMTFFVFSVLPAPDSPLHQCNARSVSEL